MACVNSVLRLIGALLRGNGDAERARFQLLEKLGSWVYPKYKFSEFARLWLEDSEFMEICRRFDGDNSHCLDRRFALSELAEASVAIEGDTAECGVYRGASSYLICRAISGADKRHHIFDSFEGLSRPDVADGAHWKTGDLAVSEAEVRESLKTFPFTVFHPGWIPQRFCDVESLKFCFVHIDVDLYKPTLDSLEFFYPRMSLGGAMVCDDYGFATCPGARRAMDEFFGNKPEKIVHLPTGQGFVIRRG